MGSSCDEWGARDLFPDTNKAYLALIRMISGETPMAKVISVLTIAVVLGAALAPAAYTALALA